PLCPGGRERGRPGDVRAGAITAEGGMTTETVETNGHGTTDELARLEMAYRIIQRRDGTAERRAFQWKLLACALMGITLGVGVWDHLDRRESLQGFVQVVQ